VLITGHGDIAMAVQAMREGAYDFLEKPCSSEQLAAVVRRAADKRQLALEVASLKRQLESWPGIQATLLGRSAAMQRVRALVRTLAAAPADVVLYGETGTGKDLVARCLHEHSARRQAHFVPVNCAGLPESLVDSEIFGHEAGAFTGATRRRIGKFEHAHGGTLFLDEIEGMPLPVQAKLLRALQDRSIERLGSNQAVPVDCRVVAASKEDLRVASEQGRFRSDLYYRLGVAFIALPPLRERREDIPLLFEHFVLQAARRYELPAPLVTPEILTVLMAHAWPGNVRELRNVVERLVVTSQSDLVEPAFLDGVLPAEILDASTFRQRVDRFERRLIEDAMRKYGNTREVARALGISQSSVVRKLRRGD
jgi:two-component system C4-dicarboxylate transport response regulator DctD